MCRKAYTTPAFETQPLGDDIAVNDHILYTHLNMLNAKTTYCVLNEYVVMTLKTAK